MEVKKIGDNHFSNFRNELFWIILLEKKKRRRVTGINKLGSIKI